MRASPRAGGNPLRRGASEGSERKDIGQGIAAPKWEYGTLARQRESAEWQYYARNGLLEPVFPLFPQVTRPVLS